MTEPRNFDDIYEFPYDDIYEFADEDIYENKEVDNCYRNSHYYKMAEGILFDDDLNTEIDVEDRKEEKPTEKSNAKVVMNELDTALKDLKGKKVKRTKKCVLL